MTSFSYEQVPIHHDSVVYCDPPYKGTVGYLGSFDHDKFWGWVRAQQHPVFVSEYTAPEDIKTIMAINNRKSLSSNKSHSVEKLFGNEAAMKALK